MRRYGWRPDKPDVRDSYMAWHYRACPVRIDLTPMCPPVYDQGDIGSCTANAIAGAIEFERIKQGLPDFRPSRLFIYYNERDMEGDPQSDSGAEIRDGIKSVATLGACPESDWPYEISQLAVKPPSVCYVNALKDLVQSYARVQQTMSGMRGVLSSERPFVFGISVYDSFESDAVANTGTVPMPSKSESMLGGHAMLCVGYDDDKQVFIARNSWGSGWGRNGYCHIPYAYLLSPDLSADFWTINVVGQQQ